MRLDKEQTQFSLSAECDDSTPVTMEWYRVRDDGRLEKMQTLGDIVIVDDAGNLMFNLPINSTIRSIYSGKYMAVARTLYSRDNVSVTLTVEEPEREIYIVSTEGFLFNYPNFISNRLDLIRIVKCLILLLKNFGD